MNPIGAKSGQEPLFWRHNRSGPFFDPEYVLVALPTC